MSDLQCPARILVARHGEAEYDEGDVLTDAGGRLTGTGRDQAAALAARLRDENVAAVYTSTLERARQTGGIVATTLGLEAVPVEGVHEFRVGELEGRPGDDPRAREVYVAWLGGDVGRRWPGSETGSDVVRRFVTALADLADAHRGETVVVVSHGGVMSLAIPHTATNVGPELAWAAAVPNCAVAELAVDADGWRLVGDWPGRRWDAAEDVPEGGEAPDATS